MKQDQISKALRDTLISPNECDRNLEPANAVDALYYIGRGLFAIAKEMEKIQENGVTVCIVNPSFESFTIDLIRRKED